MYASGFVERIILAADRLVDYPKVGRVVPETNDENVRELLYQGYRLIYRVKGDSIEMLSVIHGAGSGRDQTGSLGGWLIWD
jgi:toxin ParE1/3/4